MESRLKISRTYFSNTSHRTTSYNTKNNRSVVSLRHYARVYLWARARNRRRLNRCSREQKTAPLPPPISISIITKFPCRLPTFRRTAMRSSPWSKSKPYEEHVVDSCAVPTQEPKHVSLYHDSYRITDRGAAKNGTTGLRLPT
jgi:hypothetical protein